MTIEEKKENFKKNISKMSVDELYKFESWLKSKKSSIDANDSSKHEDIFLFIWMINETGEKILDKILSGE